MGYINRNQGFGGGFGDDEDVLELVDVSESQKYCLTIQGKTESIILFKPVTYRGTNDIASCTRYYYQRQFDSYLEAIDADDCASTCNRWLEPKRYNFFLRQRPNSGYNPKCTLPRYRPGMFIDWDCLKEWCDEARSGGECPYFGEIQIIAEVDRKVCLASDFVAATAARDYWNSTPQTLPGRYRDITQSGGEQVLFDLLPKAFECLCKAIAERDAEKLFQVLSFLDFEENLRHCRSIAEAECKEKYPLLQDFDAMKACVEESVETCIRQKFSEVVGDNC